MTRGNSAAPRDQLPPRLLPILYFAVAHAALTLAAAVVAANPRGIAGFFYHPRMLAVVHLVTLGWITASILGALYLVGPIALRVSLRARWPDYVAFALVLGGLTGLVAHFWIEQFSGMAWSAATAAAGILIAGLRLVPSLWSSPAPPAVRAHVVLAFANIAVAATMGVLLGIEKVHHILPGYVLDNVYAHAHLAALGWATMMVVGIAYRLLPMVLPSAMPDGASLWVTAVLLETGSLGLFLSLLERGAAISAPALLIVLGLAAFVAQIAWMIRHPRPRPPAIGPYDPARLHAGAAFLSMAIATALGLYLAVAVPGARMPRIAVAYGVFGLLGFLAQMVVGMEGRLLPIFAWYWAFANSGYKGPVPPPHAMAWRPAQHLVVALWWFAVPALATGLALDAIGVIRAGAVALLAAAVADSAQLVVILRHAYMHVAPPRTSPLSPANTNNPE